MKGCQGRRKGDFLLSCRIALAFKEGGRRERKAEEEETGRWLHQKWQQWRNYAETKGGGFPRRGDTRKRGENFQLKDPLSDSKYQIGGGYLKIFIDPEPGVAEELLWWGKKSI